MAALSLSHTHTPATTTLCLPSVAHLRLVIPATSRFWPKSGEGRWYCPASMPRSSARATCRHHQQQQQQLGGERKGANSTRLLPTLKLLICCWCRDAAGHAAASLAISETTG